MTDGFEVHRVLNAFQEIVQEYLISEEKPYFSYYKPEEIQSAAELEDPDFPAQDWQALTQHLKKIAHYTPSTARTSFASQLFSGREASALLGQMLSSFLNSSMATYRTAGIQVLLEQKLLRLLSEACGFPGGYGSFFPGGSLSNFTALLAARTRYFPKAKEDGIYPYKPALYMSEEAHYSIKKNAHIGGFGSRALRRVPCDERGRMLPSELRGMIQKDKKDGFRPFFICATAGTTAIGVFDPIEEITQIAREEDLWVHIDGAFGASALLGGTTRHYLQGSEKADSLTWDPHKMLGVPLLCSAAVFREASPFQEVFPETASYLFQSERDFNPASNHLQCGRENNTLKLWSMWKFYGKSGIKKRIETLFSLADQFADLVEAHEDFILLQRPESPIVCFRHRSIDSKALCRQLALQGTATIGYAVFRNQSYLRMVCVNARASKGELENLLAAFADCASKLMEGNSL